MQQQNARHEAAESKRFASVPPLPAHYQPRPDVEAEHRAMLLRATGAVALTASFDGPAGIGKTTLAKAMCHDEEVRRHFSDGIHWLVFGRERSGSEVLTSLAAMLDVAAASAEAINARVASRRLLLVLDDIWTAEQVEAFAELTAGGDGLLATLITTRNAQLAAASAGESMRLEQLNDDAALRMIRKYMGGGFKAAALKADADDTAVLLRACRGNAAMLRSVAGLCRKRGVAGAVRHLLDCSARQQHASLPDDAGEYGTLYAALEGALSNMSAELARCAAMLAVFPEDCSVPLAVVGQLWASARGARSAEALDADVCSLEACHLIDVDWRARMLSMIDLHLDYLRCRGKSELPGWHAELLRGCGRRTVGVDVGDTMTDAYCK